MEKATMSKKDASEQPHVDLHGYAKDTLALVLLLMESTDTVMEGDDNRIILLEVLISTL